MSKTNEDRAREAAKQIADVVINGSADAIPELAYFRIILASLEQAASEDTARLDWLASEHKDNMGLKVGGYLFRSRLIWQQTRIREAIDAARKAVEPAQQEGKS
jgi:hypothetical protein